MRLPTSILNVFSGALRPPEPQPVAANAVQPRLPGYDFADTFVPAAAPPAVPTLITVDSGGGGVDPNSPSAIPTPSEDYYQQRYDDFVRRNPGVTPPDYYLDYGQKYLDRFQSLGPGDLSEEGLAWRDRTLENLQVAIEQKRAEDPEGFAELERDPEKFRQFAYETHPDAYTDAGLFDLPVQDLVKIATTPDLRDIITEDGLKQIAEVLSRVRPEDIPDIARESFEEAVNQLRDRFPDVSFPDFPSLPEIPTPNLPDLPDIPTPNLPDLPDFPSIPRPSFPG